jgi:hypothetical protein
MNRSGIFQANRQSSERMASLVQRLSPEQLTQTADDQWPVYVSLAHVAFWDQRAIHVIELAKKNGELVSPLFDDSLNDILAPILGAIPPEKAAGLAVELAGKLDRMLEECPPELIDRMMQVNNRLVERSLHRTAHLDDIEALLRGK